LPTGYESVTNYYYLCADRRCSASLGEGGVRFAPGKCLERKIVERLRESVASINRRAFPKFRIPNSTVRPFRTCRKRPTERTAPLNRYDIGFRSKYSPTRLVFGTLSCWPSSWTFAVVLFGLCANSFGTDHRETVTGVYEY